MGGELRKEPYLSNNNNNSNNKSNIRRTGGGGGEKTGYLSSLHF